MTIDKSSNSSAFSQYNCVRIHLKYPVTSVNEALLLLFAWVSASLSTFSPY